MTTPDDIIKEFGLEPMLFPDGIKQYLSKFLDDNGAITLWSVGLMLPESDLDLVRTCIYQFNPLVVITANKELYRLGLKESLESLDRDDEDEFDVEKLATQPIRFTHFAPWYEQNIWLKLFSAPIKNRQKKKVKKDKKSLKSRLSARTFEKIADENQAVILRK